jgi:hypothetical protein
LKFLLRECVVVLLFKFPGRTVFGLKFPGRVIFQPKFPGSGAPSAPHFLQPWGGGTFLWCGFLFFGYLGSQLKFGLLSYTNIKIPSHTKTRESPFPYALCDFWVNIGRDISKVVLGIRKFCTRSYVI